jgi:hypothetical protein
MSPPSNIRLQRSYHPASDSKNAWKVQQSVLCMAHIGKQTRCRSRSQRLLIAVSCVTSLHSTPKICVVCRPGKRDSRNQPVRCSASAGIVDRTLMVKFSLAQTSNQLDLSECGLTSIPEELFALTNLEVGSGVPTMMRNPFIESNSAWC